MTTNLEPHRRGDTFVYTFSLSSGWTGASFTGGVKFTLRTSLPASSVITDVDAVHQASVANGQIVFAGATGTITIPASSTTTWPTGRLYWDLRGVIAGSPAVVHTIDDGSIRITHDITRAA